jgi:hypothetical protein
MMGMVVSCADDEGDGAPKLCRDMVDDCGDCPAGLNCGPLSAGGFECYMPCDTADDCGGCEMESVCGFSEGDRQLCAEPP